MLLSKISYPVVPEALSLKNIHKQFGNLHANHDISISLKRGEVLALLGENGAGKTTTVNMITGILEPDKGEVIINGKSIIYDLDEVRKDLGLCQQHDVNN